MEYNRNSPTTSGGNTPTIPTGAEGNSAGMIPQMAGMNPQMAGMNPHQMAGMAGMSPQMFYNMYSWMSQMGGMMPAPAGMGGMMPPPAGVGGMMPAPAGVGGSSMQYRSPTSARESVYRPYIDLLSDDSPSAVPETQFPDIENFSLEELGISPIHLTPVEPEPEPATRGRSKGVPRGRGRGKGKGKAPSSSSHTGAQEEEEEGEDETERRTVWTVWENAALAKAWHGVVEDPYVGPHQHVDRMWHRIKDAYIILKPSGAKVRTSEQCRKQWLRLRPKLSRFAALYQNNMRMATSGMSEDDVKNLALSQFPDKELKFRDFDQWEAFLVVRDSQKFAAGVDVGWKRTKINSSGEYSSSAGSHELPEAEEVAPLPRTDSRRRRRPMGQQAAQRLARGRGSGSASYEVESEAQEDSHTARLARAQLTKTLYQSTLRWHSAQDPVLKRMCKDVVDQCRRDLGMPVTDDNGDEIGGGDVGGGSGTGDGDEDDEEE